jgi:outer membrane receptor protein involved in Fe transport
VANLALQFYQPDWGTMFRFLTSYTGKRVTDVGAYGLPDIYEAGYASVDAVISQRLNHWRGIEVKIAANNLLAADRRFLQAGAVQRRYEPGRSMSVSLSYTPF